MLNHKKVVWRIPTEYTAPKQWWALKKHLLSTGPLVRISLASFFSCGLIVLGFQIAVPGIAIPNLLGLLFVFPMLMAMLTLQTYLLTKICARVVVTPTKVVVSHGESTTIIKLDSIIDVVLAIHDKQKARLRIRYMRRGKRRLRVLGICESLDLVELERLMPMEITPKDYRCERRKTIMR